MLRLLLLRAVPLFFRPAAVLFEGAVIAENYFLVMVLPIAMMALTISSIPVHLDYFKCLPNNPGYNRLAKKYISSLAWLILASLLVLSVILILLPLGLDGGLLIAICLVFLVEKLADETSRILEFRKAFVNWFLVQSFRSGWLFLPIIVSLFGLAYEVAFLTIAALSCIFMYYIFYRVSGLAPCFDREGFSPIRDNLVFLAGSVLPSSYRQVPRIVVAKVYPEQAHIFLAMAQLAQGIGLIFNVRFQIPYRKLIARRTVVFQRLLQPTMLWILMPSGVIAIAYLAIPFFTPEEALSNATLALLLAPVMLADALTFAILAAHLGYLPWFVGRKKALGTYLLCLAAVGGGISGLYYFDIRGALTLLMVPSITVIIGFFWIMIIVIRHFRRTSNLRSIQ